MGEGEGVAGNVSRNQPCRKDAGVGAEVVLQSVSIAVIVVVVVESGQAADAESRNPVAEVVTSNSKSDLGSSNVPSSLTDEVC